MSFRDTFREIFAALAGEVGRATSEARDKVLLQGWFGNNLHPNLDADANPRDLHWQVEPPEPTVHTPPRSSFAERCNERGLEQEMADRTRDLPDRGVER